MVEMYISALNTSKSSPGNFTVILQETEGERSLGITIGEFEAQAIAMALEDMKPPRPLTHDLMLHALDLLEARVDRVIISHMQEGAYVAMVVLAHTNGFAEADSRTSDALALAARAKCPVLIEETLLTASLLTSPEKDASPEMLEQLGLPELEKLLQKAIISENYERADVIKKVILGKQSS